MQELEAVGAFPARIGIGKMHADVAESGRAQQCVGDGVRKHVGVGVAFQPKFARDGDAAQDQRAARRRCGGRPNLGPIRISRSRRDSRGRLFGQEQPGQVHIGGLRDLDIAVAAQAPR